MVDDTDFPQQPAKPNLVLLLLLLAGVAFTGLLALGVWQVQRLQWKVALIERVEQRVHAVPVAAPGRAEWAAVNRQSNEYTRVQASGRFDHRRETLVRASTELGSGFWVMTPLRTTEGFWIFVNRGFVPAAYSSPASRVGSTGEQHVTGLLRLSEPGGSFLQHNDAAAHRWYSRDVQAIAASVALDARPGGSALVTAAPYFIDAAASQDLQEWPRWFDGAQLLQQSRDIRSDLVCVGRHGGRCCGLHVVFRATTARLFNNRQAGQCPSVNPCSCCHSMPTMKS